MAAPPSAPRFFVERRCSAGDVVALETQDLGHAARVLRLRPGDAIAVISSGRVWDATLIDVGLRATHARIVAEVVDAGGELPVDVTVLQALTKGAKFDEVVEKCVELGARRIVPVVCERSFAKPGSEKVDRWQRIARAAAQQSRRRAVPVVEDAISWKRALQRARAEHTLVAFEHAPPHSLGRALGRLANARTIALAVGPEGGLTPEEIDVAKAAGAELVSLGPTILRTETAAAALLAAVASRHW